jgi:hypothetical protein
LTERYCLYAESPDGTIWRNDVHHHPWPLQAAEVSIERNTCFDSYIAPREPPALLHYAKRLDVVVWNAERAVKPGTVRPQARQQAQRTAVRP